MGYSTEFKGELKFTTELTASQLAKVKSFLGEDCRQHPEWGAMGMSYIDLELLDDFTGLKWDGSEKTYDLTEKVNLIITEMQKDYPEFGLQGSFIAQGEDIDDRWVLKANGSVAKREDIVMTGEKVTCPHCGEDFRLEK